jgi:predicted aconitase with swiveling domain
VVLDEPLSLWGGMDPASGRLIDHRHPQAGVELSGRILVMPSGRGSSSSSSVLAEAIRTGTAPAGIILFEPDGILVIGALVARELYGTSIPVVVLRADDYAAIETGDDVTIVSGSVTHRPVTPG